MAKKVIVVRIGTNEVQIVHMEHTANYPTVYGCVRFPTPENAVKDGMIIEVAELATCIRKACADKGIRTKNVIFTVASGKIASRETSVPIAKKKMKIQPLVMAKVSDLFPIDVEKYIFSYVEQGEPKKTEEGGLIQDVMVFAAPSDLIDSYYTLANAAGLHIESIDADGNAVFQVMRRQVKSKEGVTMSIQINQSATLVNIISDNKLLLQRVVPYGINVFTEVLLQEPVFQVQTEEEAYTLLKRNRVILHNLNSENQENNPSLDKRIEVTDNASYLIGNIGRVIEYYNSKYKDRPIQEIICMGKGCAVAGIHELLSNELGIQTHTPEELAGVRFNRKVNINAYILQYINCFGAVFDSVHFVSNAVRQKEEKKGSMTGAVLIFAGCLLISILVGGFSVMRLLQEEVVNRKMLDVFDLYCDNKNNHFHALLKSMEAQCPKSFKIRSITSDEAKVMINAISTDKLLSLSALQIQLEKIDGISSVKIDSITETNEALTKKKQYSYTITFAYNKVVDANKKASEIEGSQTE